MFEESTTAQTSEAFDGIGFAGDGNADVSRDRELFDGGETEFSENQEDFSFDSAERDRQKNSENARRRREAEQRRTQKTLERERREARDDAILETLDRVNPYTGEEMKDSRDVEEYLIMKEIEKKGGDPISDFSKFHKEKARERDTRASEEATRTEWYRRDREAFLAKHPDVNLRDLIEDEGFKLFAEGKTGNQPLAEIYEGYRMLMGGQTKQAKEIAARMLANKRASPGALSSFDGGAGDYFSPEQVRRMSPADVSRHYDTIMRSMKRW